MINLSIKILLTKNNFLAILCYQCYSMVVSTHRENIQNCFNQQLQQQITALDCSSQGFSQEL